MLELSKTMNFDKSSNCTFAYQETFTRTFFFRKLSLEYPFRSSNTKLKPLVILVIILLLGFRTQGPMGLT